MKITDKERNDFFKVNGKIKEIVRVPDVPDEPKGRTLIEYTSEQTISSLILPTLETYHALMIPLSPGM